MALDLSRVAGIWKYPDHEVATGQNPGSGSTTAPGMFRPVVTVSVSMARAFLLFRTYFLMKFVFCSLHSP
jgi:hypothetical protein